MRQQQMNKSICRCEPYSNKIKENEEVTQRFMWFDKVPISMEQRLKLSTMLYESYKRVFIITMV